MGFIIAVAGKGGTGKSTLSALIVREMIARGSGSILAVDADPNNTLGELLGLAPSKTIGQVIDEVAQHPDTIPGGMTKDRFIEFQVQSIVEEAQGFDLLTMGKPEGPGCYCYANNVLRGVLERLVKGYDITVIDNEAGLEHLSRKTMGSADCLMVVSDSSAAGLRAAERIQHLTQELKLKIKRKVLVANRCEGLQKKAQQAGIEYAGSVPQDPAVEESSRENKPVFGLPVGSPASVAVKALVGELLKHHHTPKE